VKRSWRFSIPVALLLAVAIHVDWHLARHHGRLSGAWPYHWVVAVPIFAAAGWFLATRSADRLLMVGLSTVALAAFLAQVLEPLGEYVLYDWPLRQGFGPERLRAFGLFLGVGLVSCAAAMLAAGRRAAPGASRVRSS